MRQTVAEENDCADREISTKLNQYIATGTFADGQPCDELRDLFHRFSQLGFLISRSSPTGSVLLYVICLNGTSSVNRLIQMKQNGELKRNLEDMVDCLSVSSQRVSLAVEIKETYFDATSKTSGTHISLCS